MMATCLIPWALGIALVLSVIFAILRKGRIDLWHILSFFTIGAGMTGGTVMVGSIVFPKYNWPYLDPVSFQVIGGISTAFVSAQMAWRRIKKAIKPKEHDDAAATEAAASREEEDQDEDQ